MSDFIKHMPYDEDPVIRSDEGTGTVFSDVVERRLSRRQFLGAGLALAAAAASGGLTRALASPSTSQGSPTGLNFIPIQPKAGDAVQVPPHYRSQVVARWGDPIKMGAPAFRMDAVAQTPQDQCFGYNCDFVGYHPLPFGSSRSDHGLLSVNFEYINPELMFPVDDVKALSREQVVACMNAVGTGVVEIKKTAGKWEMIQSSPYNARLTAFTPMKVGGPAAGDARMKTSAHAEGMTSTGTFANCAAGKTPWGTVLTAEENFQSMFGYADSLTDAKAVKSAARYGIGKQASEYGWERYFDRFDARKEPNESNHFGWVVEFDPYDPTWTPVKRTALGRCRHEAATTHVTKDGKVVMYTGDDARFEYVYKFVTAERYNPANREANRGLMDKGTLYVARFDEDGTGVWLPLVHGNGPLTSANGFDSQADVVIDVRVAADLLGATKMDRPEDIEVNPVNEKVYLVCTNNVDRGRDGRAPTDKANPRPQNRHGHIIEMIEENNDHASTRFKWDLFLVCGDPKDEATYYAGYPKDAVSPISCPDNICFDPKGNLWIATDGQEGSLKVRDGFFAVPTEGPDRGKLMQFMESVVGSEVCGPEFTPDGKTAFLAIQHPGEGSTFAKPSTHWPDGSGIPRPSVIAIEAENGDVIGSRGG
ncbi:MAG: PhoX family protein [Fimbriimonadaceae bacterium]